MGTVLAFTVARAPGRDVVSFTGEVDIGSAPTLRDGLARPSAALLVADFTGVTFLGSTGLTCLLQAHDRLVAEGRALVVVTPPTSAVSRAISISGVDQAVTVVATLGDVPG
ncbi:STAS domain-containing protein [Actinokineospora inagensis]|uniref:STAS domain-containing protein n=1 Tax=Actinokineospora inagensis TaxID=103730 RepID=UPI00041C5051|nr:STAS domain-containing protein [Actinokineospora inagensis]